MSGYLSDDELIAAAAAKGFTDVTAQKLRRWRYKRLLPNVVVARGGIHGTRSLGSPRETVEQLLALCRIHKQERRLAHVRFELWWEGFPVELDAVRTTLNGFLAEDAEEMRRRCDQGGGDPWKTADQTVLELRSYTGDHPFFPLLRRRLGGVEVDLETVVHTLMLLGLGGEVIWENPTYAGPGDESEPSPEQLLARAMGVKKAQSDSLPGAGTWVDQDIRVSDVFEQLQQSGLLSFPDLDRLFESATDEELTKARDDAKPFANDLVDWVRALEALAGRDKLGLASFRVFSSWDSLKLRVYTIVGVFAARKLGQGDGIESVGQAIRATAPNARAYLAVWKRFPEYRKYLRIDAAKHVEKLSEAGKMRMQERINAFIESEPDLRVLIG